MPESEYMAFCCNDLEHPCDFKLQAKTKEEVIEHARAHVAREHGMEGPEVTKRIERAIKPANK